jgi:excisionase family DNA binding protein
MTSATTSSVFWSVSMPTASPPGTGQRPRVARRPPPAARPTAVREPGDAATTAAAVGDPPTPRLTVSVTEAASMLGISRALAYELVARGEVPSVRLGRRVVVPVAALRAMVAGGDPTPAA